MKGVEIERVPAENGPTREFDSFPNRPLTESEWRVIESSTVMEAGPLAGYPDTGEVTHLQIERSGVYYFIGFTPESQTWTQIARLPLQEPDGEPVSLDVIEVVDDETEESLVSFDTREDEELVEALNRLVKSYLDYSFDGEDRVPMFFGDIAADLAVRRND